MLHAERLVDAPIIYSELDPSIGDNIQGPSLIRVPDWVSNPLGRYYLYFADHKGSYIRLAYANELKGPWRIHTPGSLQLAASGFPTTPPRYTTEQADAARARAANIRLPHDVLHEMTVPHIASPDVHVDHERREIIMYFHGLESFGRQVTRLATSADGIVYNALPEILGRTYMRVFRHLDMTYALAMPGILYRSRTGRSDFEEGPTLFTSDMRHAALLKRDDTLYVYWTRVGDAPERILRSTIALGADWMKWQDEDEQEVLRPENDWEGASAPNLPSMRSVAYGRVNQLRDPAIFEEAGETYLLYAVAGESGIAIARLSD